MTRAAASSTGSHQTNIYWPPLPAKRQQHLLARMAGGGGDEAMKAAHARPLAKHATHATRTIRGCSSQAQAASSPRCVVVVGIANLDHLTRPVGPTHGVKALGRCHAGVDGVLQASAMVFECGCGCGCGCARAEGGREKREVDWVPSLRWRQR